MFCSIAALQTNISQLMVVLALYLQFCRFVTGVFSTGCCLLQLIGNRPFYKTGIYTCCIQYLYAIIKLPDFYLTGVCIINKTNQTGRKLNFEE